MPKTFLDKVYDVETTDETRTLYDSWARGYDSELQQNGYATPERVAKALASVVEDKDVVILDFGCGTGLSGQALAAEGFKKIDGADLSSRMLEEAHEKGVYRKLRQVQADSRLPCMQGDYSAVVAAGVISPGAAPIGVFDHLLNVLPKGGHIAFSFNDHALEDPSFTGKIDDLIKSGAVVECFREHGDHLPGIGLGSTVYVLQKT